MEGRNKSGLQVSSKVNFGRGSPSYNLHLNNISSAKKTHKRKAKQQKVMLQLTSARRGRINEKNYKSAWYKMNFGELKVYCTQVMAVNK